VSAERWVNDENASPYYAGQVVREREVSMLANLTPRRRLPPVPVLYVNQSSAGQRRRCVRRAPRFSFFPTRRPLYRELSNSKGTTLLPAGCCSSARHAASRCSPAARYPYTPRRFVAALLPPTRGYTLRTRCGAVRLSAALPEVGGDDSSVHLDGVPKSWKTAWNQRVIHNRCRRSPSARGWARVLSARTVSAHVLIRVVGGYRCRRCGKTYRRFAALGPESGGRGG